MQSITFLVNSVTFSTLYLIVIGGLFPLKYSSNHLQVSIKTLIYSIFVSFDNLFISLLLSNTNLVKYSPSLSNIILENS